MDTLKWQNRASLGNIPEELQPFVEQIIQSYRDYYGSKLKAVYLNGSLVRGDWQLGSDVDVVCFVRSTHGDVEDTKLRKVPNSLGRRYTEVDLFTISDAMRRRPDSRTKYQLMILALDGTHAWGEPVDLSGAVPTEPVAFVSRLCFDFKASYIKYKTLGFDGSEAIVRRTRRMTKMVVRLANSLAILKGAPCNSDYQSMLTSIEQFAPEWREKAWYAFGLRRAELSVREHRELLEILEELIKTAEHLGVIFASPNDVYAVKRQ